MLFPFSLLCASLASLLCAGALSLSRIRSSPEFEKIPRNRLAGLALGTFALLWCAHEATPLVSDSMVKYLYPLAIFCAWVAYMFLDFLLARAIGALFILLAHYFLFESFALKSPFAPSLPLLCLLMGSFGILISGKPHLLRDILRRFQKSDSWRISASILLFAYGVVFLSFGIFYFGQAR